MLPLRSGGRVEHRNSRDHRLDLRASGLGLRPGAVAEPRGARRGPARDRAGLLAAPDLAAGEPRAEAAAVGVDARRRDSREGRGLPQEVERARERCGSVRSRPSSSRPRWTGWRATRATREVLRELLRRARDDPFVIAETLARQTLVDRLIREAYAVDERDSTVPGRGRRARVVADERASRCGRLASDGPVRAALERPR